MHFQLPVAYLLTVGRAATTQSTGIMTWNMAAAHDSGMEVAKAIVTDSTAKKNAKMYVCNHLLKVNNTYVLSSKFSS